MTILQALSSTIDVILYPELNTRLYYQH